MGEREAGGILGSVGRLFREGTVAGLSDAQLLGRYVDRDDPAAFEALVGRYGPMVLGVCRRRLRDRHAAEDAFQATFLVLVRKAGTLRVHPSLGPWLHGVAWRVAERARADAARRRDREANDLADGRAVARPDLDADRLELAGIIDEELARLPEKYRAPVVLCHLEGLTHEEAAHRLGCPTGTVSIRLMRARSRLKDRLARRGATTATVGPFVDALAGGGLARGSVPASLIETTTRAALGTGAAAPLATRLAEGVIRAMMRSRLQRAAIGLSSIGVIVALAALAIASRDDGPKPAKLVVGKVVDDKGRPVPGAEVWLPFFLKAIDDGTVHAVADDQGRFSLPVSEECLKVERVAPRATVWAFAAGRSIGSARAHNALMGDDPAEIIITLRAATDTAFTVVGPDGRPVAGARVEPSHVMGPSNSYDIPPKGMLPLVGGVTDDRGRARLPALERKGFHSVAVITAAYGRQVLRLADRADEPAERTIRLRPVGRVEGRIVADRPELARGVTLYFTTEEGVRLGSWSVEGEARVITDDRGRFSVPALASGMMRVEGGVDPALPARLRLPEQIPVRPDDATRLDIPLESAVKVRGIVRSRETKEPLAGASISVGYGTYRQSDHVTSGPAGRFEAFVVPGDVKLHVISVPKGYVQLGAPWAEPIKVPADPGTFELPPIDLVKVGPAIPGTLVDGRDGPLAGVQVIAVAGNRRYGFARTDAAGAFTFEGVPPGIDFKYEAWTEDDVAVPAEVVRERPLKLRARLKRETIAEAGGTAAISARVVDRAGKPVAGAALVLIETRYGPDGDRSSGRSYHQFGATDAEGRIRKPHDLAKGAGYRLIVEPGSTVVVAGEEVRADGRGPVDFPPLVADRLREVQGKVVDGRGLPIGGATVMNRGNASPPSDATTGDDGAFRLGGVPSGEVFLFAKAPGFRFRGARVGVGDGPVRLALARADEPSGRSSTPPVPALARPEAAALARGMIAPDLARILAGQDREAQGRLLEALARIDPEAAWARILAGDEVHDRDAAKLGVFHAFLRNDPEKARAVLPLVKTPYYRVHGYEELYDDLPDDQAARKETIAAAGLAEARALDNPNLKFHFLMHFARRLADLGAAEEARRVVEEARPSAKAVDDATARFEGTQALAIVLGRLDPVAAEALIPEGAAERSRNDVIGAVAEGVAAIDPARAQRLIGRFTHDSSEAFAVHACRRMAAVDLARARRMAASIKSDALRAYAFGLMADTLAKADPVAATGLLDDASRAFADAVERGLGGVWSGQGAAVMAASLLPTVARACPDRLDEFLWRAVALRWQPRTVSDLTGTIPDSSRAEAMRQAAALAIHLARHDRDLARVILAPAVADFQATPAGSDVSGIEWRLILMALAQVEPGRAAGIVGTFPDLRESDGVDVRQSARLVVAKALVQGLDEVIADARRRIIDLEILLREDR